MEIEMTKANVVTHTLYDGDTSDSDLVEIILKQVFHNLSYLKLRMLFNISAPLTVLEQRALLAHGEVDTGRLESLGESLVLVRRLGSEGSRATVLRIGA